MLRVLKASGEEAFAVEFEEFVRMVREQQPVTVLALKRHLQRLGVQPRFKQHLLLPDGQMGV